MAAELITKPPKRSPPTIAKANQVPWPPQLGGLVSDLADLIIGTGKRKGHPPSVASIYRALAEHAKTKAHPEAVASLRPDPPGRQGPASAPELQAKSRHRHLAIPCIDVQLGEEASARITAENDDHDRRRRR